MNYSTRKIVNIYNLSKYKLEACYRCHAIFLVDVMNFNTFNVIDNKKKIVNFKCFSKLIVWHQMSRIYILFSS